jgi:multicomponent Na+:H+ antiporter subunit B
MAAMATVVRAMGSGLAAAERNLPLRSPLRLAGAGALLSLVSGLPALLVDRPFLAHLSATLPNGFKLSTFLPFDIGIYLAVWGVLAGFILTLLDLDPPGEVRS